MTIPQMILDHSHVLYRITQSSPPEIRENNDVLYTVIKKRNFLPQHRTMRAISFEVLRWRNGKLFQPPSHAFMDPFPLFHDIEILRSKR